MLCIHGFGNDICIEGSDFAVIKFNVINTRGQDGIVMGTPNDVTLSIAHAADYSSVGKSVATWNHNGCLDILLPVQVWLCVQCVNESNFLKLSPGKAVAPPFLSCPLEGFHMVLFDRVCNLLGCQWSVSAVVDYLSLGG